MAKASKKEKMKCFEVIKMKTHEKAVEWMGLVLDLGKANGMYLNVYTVYEVLFYANETMKKLTGMPLFREEPTSGPASHFVIYDSVKRESGAYGACPVTCYEPCTFNVDLIQINAIRKAMKLPLVHADDF